MARKVGLSLIDRPKRERVLSVTIKDCRVDTFRGSGAGGQHRNKTDSGVRVTHEPSGAVGSCQETRSQAQNKQIAFRRMAESREFQTWLRMVTAELLSGKSVDQIVDEQMDEKNIKEEIRADGKWVVK